MNNNGNNRMNNSRNKKTNSNSTNVVVKRNNSRNNRNKRNNSRPRPANVVVKRNNSKNNSKNMSPRPKSPNSNNKEGTRYFEVVYARSKGNGKYEVSTHNTLKENRFKATEKQTPVDAAKKALTRLCENAPKNGSCTMNIVLRELTRGSDHKLYFYKGDRSKYETPKVAKMKEKQKNGSIKIVTKTFHFDPKVSPVPESVLGHSHILGDWKVKKNNN